MNLDTQYKTDRSVEHERNLSSRRTNVYWEGAVGCPRFNLTSSPTAIRMSHATSISRGRVQ